MQLHTNLYWQGWLLLHTAFTLFFVCLNQALMWKLTFEDQYNSFDLGWLKTNQRSYGWCKIRHDQSNKRKRQPIIQGQEKFFLPSPYDWIQWPIHIHGSTKPNCRKLKLVIEILYYFWELCKQKDEEKWKALFVPDYDIRMALLGEEAMKQNGNWLTMINMHITNMSPRK